MINSIELSLFSNRVESVCDEMGAVLQRAAFSPNIKDRLDFSCAVFDSKGQLVAQAAHIPVHLGSMAFAMEGVVEGIDWQPGDMVVFNDPFLGGTHLPDVTMVSPVFAEKQLIGFVANRAHHADIGASAPGSMPLSSTLAEEGLLISPVRICQANERTSAYTDILNALGQSIESEGDFNAQMSANLRGLERLTTIVSEMGVTVFVQSVDALNDYGSRLMLELLQSLPEGCYQAEDVMDDDGLGQTAIPIRLNLAVSNKSVIADFAGTAPQVKGNINCPLSVVAAAVYYVFRCLMPSNTPACFGVYQAIQIKAPKGSFIYPHQGAAVAAGNVETSTRLVDVVMKALAKALPERMAAASHGSMNNIAMGSSEGQVWNYYETIGGGMGAHARGCGVSAKQTHMTNTLNTPIESLEMHYLLRVDRYQVRRNSGGQGKYTGGDGLVRELTFLAPTELTLLTERRSFAPWGLNGGKEGECGMNMLNGNMLSAKTSLSVNAGDRLTVMTPGGGGYGETTNVV